MCYKLVIVDYTKRDENGDPMIKLVLGDLEFPSLVLGELIVEKVLLDLKAAQDAGPTPQEMVQLEEYPLALINIHDGEVTVFSDNRPTGPGTGPHIVDWEVDDRFRTAYQYADNTQTRLENASKLISDGVSEDALWSSLARFLIVAAPALLGMADDDPVRLQVLAERQKIDEVAGQLAERFGDPDNMTEEQILAAVEEFASSLSEAPSATDPSIADNDNDNDAPPAPKGLKIRGE